MDSNKRAFVAHKIQLLKKEGKGQDQAIAIALSMAKEGNKHEHRESKSHEAKENDKDEAHSPARQKRDIKFRLSRPNTQTS